MPCNLLDVLVVLTTYFEPSRGYDAYNLIKWLVDGFPFIADISIIMVSIFTTPLLLPNAGKKKVRIFFRCTTGALHLLCTPALQRSRIRQDPAWFGCDIGTGLEVDGDPLHKEKITATFLFTKTIQLLKVGTVLLKILAFLSSNSPTPRWHVVQNIPAVHALLSLALFPIESIHFPLKASNAKRDRLASLVTLIVS
ncbi:hypothetical protein NE237_006293 [Protea cynaroides]|uniref:Uncharacterized protein n=1 Tax=Protea cynaroides TaxID=273540 RepID=A0A9Q0KMV6_9MAGN|nr:hypothetical protein NE237_006293 [Protea cynaroides]